MKHLTSFVLLTLVLAGFSSTVSAQTKSREQLLEDISTKRNELSNLEKEFLAVPDADRSAFVELLDQPNTGLIRLLPRDVFDSAAYKKIHKTLTINGGGAYYSFARLTHEYGQGSDLSFESGHFSVGFAGADYGMIVKIGDIPLHDLSTTHPIAVPLTRYIPAQNEPAARVEQRKFSAGTEIEGLALNQRVPVEVNATYLLRSICYRRSDVLVAIRVARRDSDGSVILAWKLLEKYSAPQLARND